MRVGWTPDSRKVVYAAQNRTQTWLDLNLADPGSGATQTLLRETSRFWISADDVTLPSWLKDGSFLWLSDRSGWIMYVSLTKLLPLTKVCGTMLPTGAFVSFVLGWPP